MTYPSAKAVPDATSIGFSTGPEALYPGSAHEYSLYFTVFPADCHASPGPEADVIFDKASCVYSVMDSGAVSS